MKTGNDFGVTENLLGSPPPAKMVENSSTPCRSNQNAMPHSWSLYELKLRRKLERQNSTILSSPSSSNNRDSVLSSVNFLSQSHNECLPRHSNCNCSMATDVPSASSPINIQSIARHSKSRMDSFLESNLMGMHLNSASEQLGVACSTCALLSPTSCLRTPSKSNPFEEDLLSTIHLPSFSPSVFSQITTPSKTDILRKDNFLWSVDNLSAMYPADIQIPEHENDNGHEGPDQETEEQVQKAINEFFSQHVMPSPWLEQCTSKVNRTKHKTFSPQFADIEETSDAGTNPHTPCAVKTKDACTQTILTLPVAFDLEKVLASCYTYRKSCDNDARDSNGEAETNLIESINPSLRRKLFVGDKDTTPNSEDDCRSKLPRKCIATPVQLPEMPYDTDTPNLLSSSPITFRTSTNATPPPLSPIEKSKCQIHESAVSPAQSIAESMVYSPRINMEPKQINRQEISHRESLTETTAESGVFTPGINNHDAVKFLLETPKCCHLEPMVIDQNELRSVSFMDTSDCHPGIIVTSQDNGYLTGSL